MNIVPEVKHDGGLWTDLNRSVLGRSLHLWTEQELYCTEKNKVKTPLCYTTQLLFQACAIQAFLLSNI